MKASTSGISTQRICQWFGLSRQAYYQSLKRCKQRAIDTEIIVQLTQDTRRRCGARLGTGKVYHCVKEDLRTMGMKVGRDGFYRILREQNLLIKPRRRAAHRTTDSSKWRRQFADLRQDLVVEHPEQLWVSDITYLRLSHGFAYLSLVTDAYSRQIMGWQVHEDLSTKGCLQALSRALKRRTYPASPLIHHSDRGCQYCSAEYVSELRGANIRISMTQNGSPYENPMAESVNGQLKVEYALDRTFDHITQARAEVLRVIQQYNEQRPHGSIDMEVPAERHQKYSVA
jgi:transposase InsO family protein